MPTPEIQEFAKLLVELVRDDSISACSSILQAHSKSPTGMRWKKGLTPEEALREAIPDVVDDVVFHLLDAIDNGRLRLIYTSTSGRNVDLTIDGRAELGGRYLGADGWRATHSRQSVHDD